MALKPRIRRTRQLLQGSLRKLMQTKSFDEISVQDIAEAATCRLSRAFPPGWLVEVVVNIRGKVRACQVVSDVPGKMRSTGELLAIGVHREWFIEGRFGE